MELLEIFIDAYYLLGSAVDSLLAKTRNYRKLIERSEQGDDNLLTIIRAIPMVREIEIKNSGKVKYIILDGMGRKNGMMKFHLHFVDGNFRYIESSSVHKPITEINCSINTEKPWSAVSPLYWNISLNQDNDFGKNCKKGCSVN